MEVKIIKILSEFCDRDTQKFSGIYFDLNNKKIVASNGKSLIYTDISNLDDIKHKKNFIFNFSKILNLFSYEQVFFEKEYIKLIKNENELKIYNNNILNFEPEFPDWTTLLPKEYNVGYKIAFNTELLPRGVLSFEFNGDSLGYLSIQKAKYVYENNQFDILFMPVRLDK